MWGFPSRALYWEVTGRQGATLDRWKARDHLLERRWALRVGLQSWFALWFFFFVVAMPWFGSGGLARTEDTGMCLLSLLAVIGSLNALEASSWYARHRSRRLASIGFTEAGVPYEWLPSRPDGNPPPPPAPEWSPPSPA